MGRVLDVTLRIDDVDGTDDDFAQWCMIFAEGRAAESGSRADVAGAAARVRADPEFAAVAARLDGRLVGVASANPDESAHVFARVYVPPPHRRSGVGRALAGWVGRWSSGRGHSTVRATVVAGGPGEAFAASLGASVVIRLVTVERRLELPAPPVAAPSGLRLQHWRDGTPADQLDTYAGLRRAVADAPEAHLQIDAGARTGAWVRAWERDRTGTGNELWVTAAVHGDELVGFTEVEVPAAGGASQHDTAVLPDWRGRGLGRWMKADMIERLRADRPAVSTITSTVNATNVPMLAVCAGLGFREVWRRQLVVCPTATLS